MTTTSLSHASARGHSPVGGDRLRDRGGTSARHAAGTCCVAGCVRCRMTEGGWVKMASGAMAIVGSLLVIPVYHLGYAEFRQHAVRAKLVGALVYIRAPSACVLANGQRSGTARRQDPAARPDGPSQGRAAATVNLGSRGTSTHVADSEARVRRSIGGSH
jgi:hypothetical protein